MRSSRRWTGASKTCGTRITHRRRSATAIRRSKCCSGTSDPARSLSSAPRESADPDGDRLRHRWWIYHEAGTYPAEVSIANADTAEATLTVPRRAAGQIHVILEVTDDGTPPLTAHVVN